MGLCRECKQKINVNATRCHYCGANQDWMRYITGRLGLLTLTALLVSLVTILTAQPIRDRFVAKRADISVSILEGDGLYTTFMVSNVGNRAAGLAQITIESRNRKTSATWYLTSDLDKKIIEPGKSYMIKASNGGEVPAVLPLEEASAIKTVINDVSPNYNLVLSYFQANGRKEVLYIPFVGRPTINEIRSGVKD